MPEATEPMLMPLEDKPLEIRKRRPLDKERRKDLAEQVLRQVTEARSEREEWMEKRLARYAKMRGALEQLDDDWRSNQHIPLMMANSLRVEAGLFNAVLGIRPVIYGKPTRKDHKDIAERNDHLLDHQMFVDQDGDRRLERYINQFVNDGTTFSFQPRIKEQKSLHESRVIPKPDAGFDLKDYLQEQIPILAEEHDVAFLELTVRDDDGYTWHGVYEDPEGDEQECHIEVFDKGKRRLELIFEWPVVTYDGPSMLVCDLEDIVAPMRAENLQPVASHNPGGALWVCKISRVDKDTVKRRKEDGTYDLLTDEDVEDLVEGAVPITDADGIEPSEDSLREMKDTLAGVQPEGGLAEDDQYIAVYEWYGRYDLNDDGLDEEVIAHVVGDEPPQLARIRYLSEQYPGLPPVRPFSEARFIPVPGQLYGMGLPEIMEGLNDFIHELINDNVDAGRITNMPWFGYRASSGFKPDVLRLEPGMGVPLDNPAQDLAFYNMPHADQTWAFNMTGMALQFLERLVQIGPLQMGQVPQGKASALRTVGTTMAILQQGAAMPEQILRRLLMGIRDIYGQFHLLNTRYLPPKKRFLVVGKPLDNDEAYGVIDDRKDISIPLTFDFQATLLNTNKGVVAQSLLALGGALFSPLAFQTGLATPEQLYNWAHDVIQAHQLDPARYIAKPPGMPQGERISVHEAILDISQGVMPRGTDFVEPIQEALSTLMQFMQSDQFGFLSGGTELLFKSYLQMVMERVRAEMMQQQLMQASAQFTQALGDGQGGGGGRPPEPGQAPEMQTQTPTADEIMGAEKAGAVM